MEENYKLEHEYKIAPLMYEKAYRAYQRKFVFPKNYLFMAIFLILAADFVYAAVKTPDNPFAYILIVICLALAFREWHNPHFMRARLIETVKDLGEPVYHIGISENFIDITTVDDGFPEEPEDDDEKDEASADGENKDDDDDDEENELPSEIDPYPDKTRIELDEKYRLIEYDDLFLMMQGKEMFYILPKEGLSEEKLDIIRKTDKKH